MDAKKDMYKKQSQYKEIIRRLNDESEQLMRRADAILAKELPKQDLPKKDAPSTSRASGSTNTSVVNYRNHGAILRRSPTISKHTCGATVPNYKEYEKFIDPVPPSFKPRQSRYIVKRETPQSSEISATERAIMYSLKTDNNSLNEEIRRLQTLANRNAIDLRIQKRQQKSMPREKQVPNAHFHHFLTERRKFQNVNLTFRASMHEENINRTEINKYLKKNAVKHNAVHKKIEQIPQRVEKLATGVLRDQKEQKDNSAFTREARNLHVRFADPPDKKTKR